MLLGHKIVVYTDHKDLLNVNANSPDRVQRWRLILEEYGVHLKYIKGDDNIVADAFSRMEIHKVSKKELQQREALKMLNAMRISNVNTTNVQLNPLINKRSDVNNTIINHIFQNSANNIKKRNTRKTKATRQRRQPEQEPAHLSSLLSFPIQWIQLEAEQRRHDKIYQKACDNKDDWSIEQVLEGRHSIVMKNNRYYIPDHFHSRIIEWYHEMLRHPGATRLYKTLNRRFYIKGLRHKVNQLVRRCSICQKYKKAKRKYGKLPAKQSETTPWDTVCVDLVGPYTVETDKGDKTLHCLTIIDPVTYWVELIEIQNKTAEEVALQFDRTWLTRHPRPNYCTFDK